MKKCGNVRLQCIDIIEQYRLAGTDELVLRQSRKRVSGLNRQKIAATVINIKIK